ncbi:MAG: DNA topoisomerase, partial [Bacteroidales bacterium]
LGDVNKIEFKASGKVILDPGWRVLFIREKNEDKEDDDDKVLPDFKKGESGPHVPSLLEKWTQPPKLYTEATLLRAMETAGKLVEDESLRDALKENGIGRPSTRAAIIETLFRRKYIRKEKKNLIATQTGIDLIQIIHEELLKSAELTGIWENKLRKIERNEYKASEFLSELKQMVAEIVWNVKNDRTNRSIAIQEEPVKTIIEKKAREKKAKQSKSDSPADGNSAPKKRAPRKKEAPAPPAAPIYKQSTIPQVCPACGKGTILKGKTAYGCSEWKSGCTFRIPFDSVKD